MAQQNLQLVDKNQLKIAAETDYMTSIIDERQHNLDNTEKMMRDIKDIAVTLQTNTAEQGKVLVRTDQNMDVAKDNAEEAHKEIVEAQKHQKSGGKWMCYILAVIFTVAAVIVIIVLATKN